mgnify:CR=1 FL=1
MTPNDWSELTVNARLALKSCEAAFLMREYSEGEQHAATLKYIAAQLEEFGKIARRLASLGR